MSVDDVVDGYAWWTFSDIFEENYFPSVPFHGGFGLMNLYGIPKPVYRAFEMLRALGDERVELVGAHETVAGWVGCGADVAASGTDIVLINQAMPRHPIVDENVALRLACPPGIVPTAATVARIDAGHADPVSAWEAMGSPEYLSPAEVDALVAASMPVAEAIAFTVDAGKLAIDVVVAPQSVNHVRIEWHAARR
jgi:xylan 1,4-beta-xylosidase